jgi:small subunit ribosomal protein S20
LANIKSQIKRIKTSKKQNLRNRSAKSALKTYFSNFEIAVEENDKEKAGVILKKTIKEIDKAASKNIIHLNNAANKKSKLVKRFNALSVV